MEISATSEVMNIFCSLEVGLGVGNINIYVCAVMCNHACTFRGQKRTQVCFSVAVQLHF